MNLSVSKSNSTPAEQCAHSRARHKRHTDFHLLLLPRPIVRSGTTPHLNDLRLSLKYSFPFQIPMMQSMRSNSSPKIDIGRRGYLLRTLALRTLGKTTNCKFTYSLVLAFRDPRSFICLSHTLCLVMQTIHSLMLLLRTLLKLGEQSRKKISSIKDRVCCKSKLAPKAIRRQRLGARSSTAGNRNRADLLSCTL